MNPIYFWWSTVVAWVALMAIPTRRLTPEANAFASLTLALVTGWALWWFYALAAWKTRNYRLD